MTISGVVYVQKGWRARVLARVPRKTLLLVFVLISVLVITYSGVYLAWVDSGVAAWISAAGGVGLFGLLILGFLPASVPAIGALADLVKRLVSWSSMATWRTLLAVSLTTGSAYAAFHLGPASVYDAGVVCLPGVERIAWETWYERNPPHYDNCTKARSVHIWDFRRGERDSLCRVQCFNTASPPAVGRGDKHQPPSFPPRIDKTDPYVQETCDIAGFQKEGSHQLGEDYCGRQADQQAERREVVAAEFLTDRPKKPSAMVAGPAPVIVGGDIYKQMGCRTLFGAAMAPTPFDAACHESNEVPNAALAAQNNIKNNFCAAGFPARIGFSDFLRLQIEVEGRIPFGSLSRLPSDRKELQGIEPALGEGRVVQISGFIPDAHFSDVAHGESANCDLPGRSNNDLVFALAESSFADPCATLTCEVSPHFRPGALQPQMLLSLERPVRVTGQLFFDASHVPCSAGRPAMGPQRKSNWEVHPVYDIEVCRSSATAQCRVERDEDWAPLPLSSAGTVNAGWGAVDARTPQVAILGRQRVADGQR